MEERKKKRQDNKKLRKKRKYSAESYQEGLWPKCYINREIENMNKNIREN